MTECIATDPHVADEKCMLAREKLEIWRRRLRSTVSIPFVEDLPSDPEVQEWVKDTLSLAWAEKAFTLGIKDIDERARIVSEAAKKLISRYRSDLQKKSLSDLNLEPVEKLRGEVERLTKQDAARALFDRPFVGLAFSGGGVRSASFNLGILESLSRGKKWLSSIDYLSTVSGGGYIGTALSVHCSRHTTRFPFKSVTNSRLKLVDWIRAHASYLNHGREVNTLTLAAAILKGIALNALFIVPLVFAFLWFLTLGCSNDGKTLTCSGGHHQIFRSPIAIVSGIILCVLLFFLFRFFKERRAPDEFRLGPRVFVASSTLGLLFAWVLEGTWFVSEAAYSLIVVPLLFLSFVAAVLPTWRPSFWVPEILSWMVVGGVLLLTLPGLSELQWYPFWHLLILALGMIFFKKLIVNFIFMSILSVTAGRLNPFEQRSFSVEYGDLLGMSLVCLAIGGIPMLDYAISQIAEFIKANKETLLGGVSITGLISTAVGWVYRGKGNERRGYIAYLLRFGVVSILAVGLVLGYRWALASHDSNGGLGIAEWIFAGGLVLVWLTAAAVTDLNYMSMHRYYRNRLADAFLTDPAVEAVLDRVAERGWNISREAASYLGHRPLDDVERVLKFVEKKKKPKRVDLSDERVDLADAMQAVDDLNYKATECILKEKKEKEVECTRDVIAYLAAYAGDDKDQREQLVNRLTGNGKKISLNSVIQACAELGRPPGGVQLSGDFRLIDIDVGRTGTPYHLINANLVLPGSRSEKYRIRYGDSFIFSPLFVGSNATHWAKTSTVKGNERSITPSGRTTAATAMAISGAAVDPNTGETLSMPLRIVMTLLNVRLGYWLLRPGERVNRLKRLLHESWIALVVREMFAMMDEKSAYIRLSDGGHFENLGLYELIRRRCRKIIVCDAAADPDRNFGDLARAVERIRVDFGVEISINNLDLEQHQKWHRPHKPFLLGTIKYPPRKGQAGQTQGEILYIKASLFVGLDAADVIGYAKAHESFPHETTADQFFSEEQFEAYRQLGFRVAEKTIAENSSFL